MAHSTRRAKLRWRSSRNYTTSNLVFPSMYGCIELLHPNAAVRQPWDGKLLKPKDLRSEVTEGMMIVLLLFLQKQNLATAIYLFGLGTLLTGLGLKHMRIRSHHDLAGALVTSLLLGRPWWSTTSPTCLPLSVFTITSDQHRCRIPPLL